MASDLWGQSAVSLCPVLGITCRSADDRILLSAVPADHRPAGFSPKFAVALLQLEMYRQEISLRFSAPGTCLDLTC